MASDSASYPTENPTTNGPSESSKPKTATDIAKAIDESLDKFEESVGIPRGHNPNLVSEAEELLNADRDYIDKLTPEECALGSWTLNQFAWHIQRVVNRETARMSAAKTRIDRIIAPYVKSLQGYYGEERRPAAVRMNEAAEAWQKIHDNAKLKIDRLSFLSNKAQDMAKNLMNLKYKKLNRGED